MSCLLYAINDISTGAEGSIKTHGARHYGPNEGADKGKGRQGEGGLLEGRDATGLANIDDHVEHADDEANQ